MTAPHKENVWGKNDLTVVKVFVFSLLTIWFGALRCVVFGEYFLEIVFGFENFRGVDFVWRKRVVLMYIACLVFDQKKKECTSMLNMMKKKKKTKLNFFFSWPRELHTWENVLIGYRWRLLMFSFFFPSPHRSYPEGFVLDIPASSQRLTSLIRIIF